MSPRDRYFGNDIGMRSGRRFELDMFGSVRIEDERYKQKLGELLAPETRQCIEAVLLGNQVPIDNLRAARAQIRVKKPELMELTKRFQRGRTSSEPYDPTNPPKDFYRELRLAVMEKLKLADTESDSLRAYTATQTPLDLIGIDAFVTLCKNNREFFVALDATLNPEKERSWSGADVVFKEPPDVDEDEDAYLAFIDDVADDVAARFQELEQRRAVGM